MGNASKSRRWQYVGGTHEEHRRVVALVGLLAAGCGDAVIGTFPPTSMRLVGMGHAAVAVPDSWATNAMRCAEPMQDTVVIDIAAVPLCGAPRPDGVESVALSRGKAFDFTADEMFTVDGVEAQRQATTCGVGAFGGPRVCAGTVYIPSLRVSFRAESSTSAAEVTRILDRVRIVADRAAVPGYELVASGHQERSGEKYVEALRTAGFTAQVQVERRAAFLAGFVLDTSPRPGTMLRPGSVVHVTVGPELKPR